MSIELLQCKVLHSRIRPKKHQFWFRYFWFLIDLDDPARFRIPFILEYNRPGLFSLYDIDHSYGDNLPLKENLIQFIQQKGEKRGVKRIKLLTSLRVLGYVFNPVSYYFIEFTNGEQASVIEICNTFKEIKPYYVAPKNYLTSSSYQFHTDKNFYISPFSALDTKMDFKVQYQEDIDIKIDINDQNGLLLFTRMRGKKVPLNRIYWYFFRYPLVTLQATFFIHLHALVLWLKKVRYHKKNENLQQQQGMIPWRQS